MTRDLKTVLITGANRGIGLEHVKAFAARGVRVFATARVPSEAVELHALSAAHAGGVMVLPYDAADPDAPARLKATLTNTPIDILLANAGMMGDRQASFGAVDVDEVLQRALMLKEGETLFRDVSLESIFNDFTISAHNTPAQ